MKSFNKTKTNEDFLSCKKLNNQDEWSNKNCLNTRRFRARGEGMGVSTG